MAGRFHLNVKRASNFLKSSRRRSAARELLRAACVAERLESRTLLAAVSWDAGGDGINWTDPLNWSTNALPGSADDVTISIATNPTIQLISGVEAVHSLASNSPLTISGSVLTTDDLTLTASQLSLTNGSLLTCFGSTANQMHELQVNVSGTLSVDATSRIDVSGNGFVPGYTTGNTAYAPVAGATHGAGSFGGLGSGSTNAVYGDYTNPNDWGSGGWNNVWGGTSGGGLARVSATIIKLEGKILANGIDSGSQEGAGSGGGIYIDVVSLSGVGQIRASGGYSYHGDPGGGGRVAVYAKDSLGFNGSIAAPGGTSGFGLSGGGAGTIYVKNPIDLYGMLIIDSSGGGSGFTPLGLPGQATYSYPDAVVIQGNGTRVVPDHTGITVEFQNVLSLKNYALLEFNGTGLVFDTPLTLASNSIVQVDGSW